MVVPDAGGGAGGRGTMLSSRVPVKMVLRAAAHSFTIDPHVRPAPFHGPWRGAVHHLETQGNARGSEDRSVDRGQADAADLATSPVTRPRRP